MKRTPPQLLAAALLALAVSWACSPVRQAPPPAPAELTPVELELWDESFIVPQQSGEKMERLHFSEGQQQLFEQEHPNQRIRVRTFP